LKNPLSATAAPGNGFACRRKEQAFMEDVVKKVALSVTLKAKLGKEEEVAAFLAGALSLVAQEAGTITWYAFRIDQRTFGIFDSFGSDETRQAHLQGAVAAALLGRAEELLDGRPEIRPVDILAEKLPA
jgi:quinol monooxygenase YgiN